MTTLSTGPGLAALGWDDGWASALRTLSNPSLWPARVSRVDRGMCTVLTGTAELRVMSERSLSTAVGDWVALGPGRDGERPQIMAVLPRRCVFRRANEAKGLVPQVVAANIDTVLICDALDGRLSLRHLERFLALAWQSGATPVVLITKADAEPPEVLAEAIEAVVAVSGDAQVLVVSSISGEGIKDLAPFLLPGQTIALLGLSGAGKSTLVNLLVGSEKLATGAVRGDGQGRHTTTHRELVLLPGGGLLIDTPGMRALSVVGASAGIEQAFGDIEALAAQCRHANCAHGGEQGCAITAAVADGSLDGARLESWLRLRAEPQTLDRAAARGLVDERKRRKAAKTASRRAAKVSGRPPELP